MTRYIFPYNIGRYYSYFCNDDLHMSSDTDNVIKIRKLPALDKVNRKYSTEPLKIISYFLLQLQDFVEFINNKHRFHSLCLEQEAGE